MFFVEAELLRFSYLALMNLRSLTFLSILQFLQKTMLLYCRYRSLLANLTQIIKVMLLKNFFTAADCRCSLDGNAWNIGSTEEIVPVAGGQAGLAAILDVLDIRRLGIEEQTYSGIVALTRDCAIKVADLHMDDDGVLPKSLSDAAIDTAIFTPTLHNPTGKTWSELRRRDLLTVADENNILLIEDDAYGHLSNTKPMAATSSNASIILVSTLSKALSPDFDWIYMESMPAD